MPKTAKEIADMIDQLQATYAATSTALMLINDPAAHDLLKARGFDPGSTIALGRKDNTQYTGIKLWESFALVHNNPQFNLNFLGSLFMTMFSAVGHELSENHYFDKTPELGFFRHARNAISHGNQFHFENGEPKRAAQFKTFTLTQALHGTPFLFEYMSTGDLFDLLDHTKAHLRNLP